MPNEQVYNNPKKKYDVKYEIDNRKREITYTVTDKQKNHVYELFILDTGLVRLHIDNKSEVFLSLFLDDKEYYFPDYHMGKKALEVANMNALMEVYEKIKAKEFIAYTKSGNISHSPIFESKQVAIITKFIDEYVLNTPESREILNQYLTRMRPQDYKKRMDKNAKYRRAIQTTTEKQQSRSWIQRLFGRTNAQK